MSKQSISYCHICSSLFFPYKLQIKTEAKEATLVN